MEVSNQTQQALRTVIQNCTLMQLAGAPSGSYLDQDAQPHIAVDGKDICVVRCSSFGKVFHDIDSHCSGAKYTTHVFGLQPCAPCRVCKPSVPNLQWYNQLLAIVLVLADNHVPIPHIALTPDDHLTADMILPILPDSELYQEASGWELNRAVQVLQKAIKQQLACKQQKSC